MEEEAEKAVGQSNIDFKRRIIAVAAVCALCALAVIMAAQTISSTAHTVKSNNIMTFGSVTIQTLETTLSADGREIAVPDTETMSESAPSSRIVRVKNIGDEPAFIRVKLSITAANSQGGEVSADHLASYVFDDPSWVERDGWYYFDSPLSPGQTTGALITAVQFDVREAQNIASDGMVHLDITAQGVQSKNNGESAFSAEGWPEEASR